MFFVLQGSGKLRRGGAATLSASRMSGSAEKRSSDVSPATFSSPPLVEGLVLRPLKPSKVNLFLNLATVVVI